MEYLELVIQDLESRLNELAKIVSDRTGEAVSLGTTRFSVTAESKKEFDRITKASTPDRS